MAIINFTVQYDLLASATDGSDVGVDADIIPLIGSVTFEPIVDSQRAVLAPSYSPRPAGFKLRIFTGFIDVDGQLKAARSGTVGVRLWANDPVFGLAVLTYRVTFNLTTPLGEPVRVDGGFFYAPSQDSVINLVNVLQSTQSIRGPRIVGGLFADGAVEFENDDGTFVDPIEIPDGTVVFVDNGDSTWSVG